MVDVVRDRISSDAAIAEHIANGEFDQISPEAKEKIAEGVVELMHGDTSVDIPVKENIDVIVTKDKMERSALALSFASRRIPFGTNCAR